MAHITLSQLRTVLGRIVAWATSKFAARNATSGKLEYADMPVVVLASMGAELDGTETDLPMSVGDTYFLPAGQGVGARIMYRRDSGNPVKISDPVGNILYCNAHTGLLYRWDLTTNRMVNVGGDGDGLRKVYTSGSDFSSLDALHSAETAGVYQVIDQPSQRIIGTLVVSCDDNHGTTPHFVTQWLFSNLALSGDDGFSGSLRGHYMEGKAHIVHRFYNASTPVSENNDIPLNTWSEWKVYGLTLDELYVLFGSKQDALVAGNGIVIGNDGKTVSVDADVVTPQSADGTFTIRIGANYYTVSLLHEHPQYQPLLTAGSNITITTDPQTGEVTISAAGGGGGSVTIDPSITGANQANPVAGGAIYTALQGKANASEMSIDAVSGDSTKMTIQLKSGVSQNVVTEHQPLAGRVQSQDVVNIVKITQAAYDALQVKDSSTLYLITES